MSTKRWTLALAVGLLIAGCGRAGPSGTVDGVLSLPGRPATDLQRAGLNFSTNSHGNGLGHTVRVHADGSFTVNLAPGSYSVIGALARTGQSVAETCDSTINIVVSANSTTHADYTCHATPVTSH